MSLPSRAQPTAAFRRACAAACASLDHFAQTDYAANVAKIEHAFAAGLLPLKGLPNITDVRVLGAAAVIGKTIAKITMALADLALSKPGPVPTDGDFHE